MATFYLKKSKLYNLVKSVLKYDSISALKYCGYKFYRGSEWLTFYADNKSVKVGCHRYANGNVWFHVTEYDEDDILVRDEIIHDIHVNVA